MRARDIPKFPRGCCQRCGDEGVGKALLCDKCAGLMTTVAAQSFRPKAEPIQLDPNL